MTDKKTLDEYQRMMDEPIIARRVTLDEFCDFIGGLDYINGRIMTVCILLLFIQNPDWLSESADLPNLQMLLGCTFSALGGD